LTDDSVAGSGELAALLPKRARWAISREREAGKSRLRAWNQKQADAFDMSPGCVV
jgi:hypothetical protein